MSIQCKIGTKTFIRDFSPQFQVDNLLTKLSIDHDSCFVIHQGRKIEGTCYLENGGIYHIIPRVLGGKGGFGSMLRAIGAQIEKTTSREACRDLSGRRMRDVNNEKKLKEWMGKEADREREKEERKQERLAAQLAGPKHKFDDPDYHKQRTKVQEDLDDALQKGLKRTVRKNGDAPSSSHSKPKKAKTSSNKDWLGMDIDSDDLDSASDNEANPGSPSLMEAEMQCSTSGASRFNLSEKEGDKSESQSANGDASESVTTHTSCSNTSNTERAIAIDANSEEKSDHVNVSNKDNANNEDNDTPIDLDKIDSIDQLRCMSLSRLKNALMSRGLKCGGTLEERAERLFSIRGLSPDQIPTSLMAKSKGVGKKSK